jgi:hypothetical protein
MLILLISVGNTTILLLWRNVKRIQGRGLYSTGRHGEPCFQLTHTSLGRTERTLTSEMHVLVELTDNVCGKPNTMCRQ